MYNFFNFDEEDLDPQFHIELTKLFKEKVGNYFPSITFLTLNQKNKFEEYCKSNTIHKAYKLNVTYKSLNTKNKFPYLIYLSKTKGKENIDAINNRKKLHTIVFSGSHFNKVCRATIQNNYKFQVLLDDIKLYTNNTPPKNYSIYSPNFKWVNKTKKQDDKIVSIGGKEDLKKPIEVIPEELIPKKESKPTIPKIKKTTPKPTVPKHKTSILDNILTNKEDKKKLEKSLKLIKSIT